MSHGSTETAEPNLTALLDLVMQLLMFFLIVANFVVEQNNQDIKLPEATTAVPIEKDLKQTLAVNIDMDGNLVISETDKKASDVQILRYMQDQYQLFSRNPDVKMDDVAVVVRGDSRADSGHIYRVMKSAKDAGFKNVNLRANRFAPAGG